MISEGLTEGGAGGWQGKLTLRYERQGDRTIPHAQTQAPLKVQRPFYPEGTQLCQSVLLHTAGGMVGGDRLSYGIHLGIDTQALITTAAAAKIYRDHPVPAEVTGQIHLEAGAWLEWLPQETIVFEGARYHSTWRVDLAVGAHWVGWEVFRLGRTARKERFCQGEVRSRLEVWQNNSLLWIDPQHLEGSETLWQSAHALNCCPVLGTFAYIGTLPEPTLVAAARLAWQDLPTPAGESGVTRLTRGMLCRYRGHSTTAARRWFTAVWQLVRPLYTCQTPVAPRVWQIF